MYGVQIMNSKDVEATIKWWKDKYEREVKENAKLRISVANLQKQVDFLIDKASCCADEKIILTAIEDNSGC